jgi:hypothetical protein
LFCCGIIGKKSWQVINMLRTKLFFGSALVVLFSSGAYAQSKTVTNADLEKYRLKRVAAEKDLRENYEALGFPSPEERARSEAESRRERAALADRLRREESARAAESQGTVYYGTSPSTTFYPYPNPSFVDYGGRYAPSYFYYRFYYPGFRYPVRRVHPEPRRFQTFRRQWRNAVRGNRSGQN